MGTFGFTPELREEAVKLVLTQGLTLDDAALRLSSASTQLCVHSDGCFGQLSAFRPNMVATLLFDSLTSMATVDRSADA